MGLKAFALLPTRHYCTHAPVQNVTIFRYYSPLPLERASSYDSLSLMEKVGEWRRVEYTFGVK